ncbi:curculin-1-like [Phalaenopsis equestris]|uniref:curculin-1-like n=1 Tax=Phalaenopsis equestris TaxID=78828 RepID=UPI0009E4BD50|nr:curculin-1-like [Phalaenopsis equestris]
MASSSRAIASILSLIALVSLLIATVVSIPIATPSYLPSGDYLRPGGFFSRSGFTLTMRDEDCNIVLTSPHSYQIWQSNNTEGGKGCRAGLEYHGSLVILNRENEDVWNSDNNRKGTYPFKVIINVKDGAVEIRDKFYDIVWSSKYHIKR